MTPADVPASIQDIHYVFVDLSEGDADRVLGAIGAGALTPNGWQNAPTRIRSIAIKKILADLPESKLLLLTELLIDDKPSLINVLSDFLATLTEGDVDQALRLVGSESTTPDGWQDSSDYVKSALIRNILMDQPYEVLELLAEYLPEDERLRISDGSAPLPVPPGQALTSVEPAWLPEAPPQAPTSAEPAWPVVSQAPTSVEPASLPEAPGQALTSAEPAWLPVPPPQAPTSVESASPPMPAAEVVQAFDGPIFVVHGHAQVILHEAVRVLERGTGREVVVLHEQANEGRTILEKFEDHATNASYAVVLLTGDDEGGIRASTSRHLRGRQNVIFELGFFFGKLGRRRVAVLLGEDVEKPSDIDGLVYISLDQVGAWKQVLARELEAVGIQVNYSRIP